MTVLFVVATIIVFLTIEALVRHARARRGVQGAVAVHALPVQSYPVRIPEGIFFARSHTWLSLFPSGKVRLGVDDFVGRLLENPEVVLLKSAGAEVRKGDPILMLKEGDRSLTIRAPMDGEILAVNDSIRNRPELLKEMLFTDGWAYMLRPRRLSELRQMLLGEETSKWVGTEFRRLRDVFAGTGDSGGLVPALLQDGGPPIAGAMKQMNEEVWERFENEFLQVR
jgi:glycine cleavage system H lipoate-binding protein